MQKLKNILTTTALALLAGTAMNAIAQTQPAGHAGHSATPAAMPADASTFTAAPAAPALSDGEIRKIDREAGKLTIRHGELKHLDMPPMTMVFIAADKALLDIVKVGDKIRFRVVMDGARMVVTEIEPAP